jgi:uncharacterized protein YuzE
MSQVSKGEVVQDQADLSALVDEDGVLVIKGELHDDLTDIVRREHERRIADLIQQGTVICDEEADVLYVNFKKPSHADDSELTDDDIIIRYENEQVVGMTILNASHRQRGLAAERQLELAGAAL